MAAARWFTRRLCGQSYLRDFINALSDHGVNYHWRISYDTPGGQAVQLFQRNVETFWKPVLWFVKGKYEGPWVGDKARSNTNDNDKRFHHWGQSESGMSDLVLRMTRPGELILDPFMGGGTTGIVALDLGRRFIDIERDAEAFETARKRIHGKHAS